MRLACPPNPRYFNRARPACLAGGPRGPAGPARPRPPDHGPASPHRGPATAGHPYGRTVLAAELAALGRTTPGQRNRTLNRTAFKVYRYVAGGLLPEEQVTAAFTQAARAIGLTAAETSRTLASARTAGLANPHTIPPPPDPSRQEIGP